LMGSYGLQARIDNNNPLYVTDEHPSAEMHYRARFYFDPNSIVMSNKDQHFIFEGYASNGDAILGIEFRYFGATYYIRAALAGDNSRWDYTSWYAIGDAPHSIELDWWAATALNANNGGITLWIDGVQDSDYITSIDNDTCRVETVRLGPVSGIDNRTRGIYYFDAFESSKLNYIGP